MGFTLKAACGCDKGRIRHNNEDNFYFAGKILEAKNDGLRHVETSEISLAQRTIFAVFDGMGGEQFGEYASFSAARAMQLTERSLADYFITERKYLERMILQLNNAVVSTANEFQTSRMGTTVVGLYFSGKFVYSCNVGDSRAYRLRSGEFMQITEDHVISYSRKQSAKAPLSQYLGIDPAEMQIEPYIAKGEIERGDWYLICSDGLTDMLTNMEISDIMISTKSVDACVEDLISAAKLRGGKDNITAIVCQID